MSYNNMKQRLDNLINRYLSRKLLVFFVASFGLFSGTLTSSDWVIIATAYVSIQGFVDIVAKLKNK
jgi:hypothetical protein